MSQLVNKNQPTRPTTLYVPLRIFCCLGSRLEGVHCHNLMHIVHKLMHTADANPKLMHFVHKLFADRCTSKKNEILPSRTPSAISFIR